MYVLQCTRKLLKRIGPAELAGSEIPHLATVLGNWTANVVVVRHRPIVLAMSNSTLLPVLLPLAPARTLALRLPAAAHEVLTALGVDARAAAAEAAAMAECTMEPARDRRILGSLKDFAGFLDAYLEGRSPVEAALHLAETPCGPLGMDCPRNAARRAFSVTAE